MRVIYCDSPLQPLAVAGSDQILGAQTAAVVRRDLLALAGLEMVLPSGSIDLDGLRW